MSWKTVMPETLDRLTWIRISMSGLDHDEEQVYVPEIDPKKTTLGFSYVAHDIYHEPGDPYHGKVSTKADLISGDLNRAPDGPFELSMDWLQGQFIDYCRAYQPRYLRLLPNCLEPELIPARCKQLQKMADLINFRVEREVAFVQYKPPAAPKACYLGYIHPVLNCDGWVYPCDSCVLNQTAGHSFANPWRVCQWSDVGKLYDQPVRSLIADPAVTCPGCVFHNSNRLLAEIVEGCIPIEQLAVSPSKPLEHPNFV
jgi:hypothetical protein